MVKLKIQKIMARRKSRNQIGAQLSRIQAAIRERTGGRGITDPVLANRSARAWDAYDRYNANIDRTRASRAYENERNRILEAGGQYTEEGNARLDAISREQNNRMWPRSVYMGTNTRGRGITISQESLDAFRRRVSDAANGLNAG